jgi:ribulose 1,5-bisphosphate synthetase/thiazole synthase
VTDYDCDVAIVGSGPYGLSAAAHLIAADCLYVRVFGEPMSFWVTKMRVGMLLRSPWAASML